jgi:hypothetical protein
MDKNSVKSLKKAWVAYKQTPNAENRDNFLRLMSSHEFSVFSCLELYSR